MSTDADYSTFLQGTDWGRAILESQKQAWKRFVNKFFTGKDTDRIAVRDWLLGLARHEFHATKSVRFFSTLNDQLRHELAPRLPGELKQKPPEFSKEDAVIVSPRIFYRSSRSKSLFDLHGAAGGTGNLLEMAEAVETKAGS